jgi:hypothetical protein
MRRCRSAKMATSHRAMVDDNGDLANDFGI